MKITNRLHKLEATRQAQQRTKQIAGDPLAILLARLDTLAHRLQDAGIAPKPIDQGAVAAMRAMVVSEVQRYKEMGAL